MPMNASVNASANARHAVAVRRSAQYCVALAAAWLAIAIAFPSAANEAVQVGPRPYYLISHMQPGALRERLQRCANGPFVRTDFSVSHRGAPLQFPEHTREGYEAAARMGAGVIECDVTFTKDKRLICRHAQCDLHTTTNILDTPLADRCTQPFQPAVFNEQGQRTAPASATCCSSDVTLAEFKTLCGKMDAANPDARNIGDYLRGTAPWRTDLYSHCGTLLSHRESIDLIQSLGAKFTPELKQPEGVTMPYDSDGDGTGDFTQQQYARQMLDEYKQAGVAPASVFPQSFALSDILFWVEHEPVFARQAVYLDSRDERVPGFNAQDPTTFTPSMTELRQQGVRIVAPPITVLLTIENGAIAPSAYAKAAKAAGLDIITWTFERSGRVTGEMQRSEGFYYQSVLGLMQREGDVMTVLDVLAQQVGVRGVFSDWPGTVTYYASCLGLP